MILSTEQKILCAISHLGTFVGFPILAPLLVLILSNDEFVKHQAKEALFFQIGLAIGFFISVLLTFVLVGIPLLLGLGIAALVLPVIAIVNICNGEDYSYPVTGKFLR